MEVDTYPVKNGWRGLIKDPVLKIKIHGNVMPNKVEAIEAAREAYFDEVKLKQNSNGSQPKETVQGDK